ncbi:MAG: DUF4153 domain-containing protein [Peptococcaceae bacterium]|nr:DUF4153 domain-containing protein [Peptococcaceae bacterium]
MRRITETVINSVKAISLAGFRFPMTVVSLLAAASVLFRVIALKGTPPLMLQKLIFTFVVGAVLGMAAQFAVERSPKLSGKRILTYGVAALLLVGYFLILLPAPEISAEITVRSLVAVFALVCMVLWIPSHDYDADFNLVALVHFMAVFTAVLYSAVLSAGLAAIIASVDTLLFKINSDAYAYTMTLIWVVFAPVYYLSLLPRFNSKAEADQSATERAGKYPRLLDILVSYIAIPLVSAYTLVLIAYFIKILFTLTWPSGQVGPMTLVYSIAGLVIFVLSSLLENRTAELFRRIFPKLLVGIVIMQLVSVGIRLNAYGVTESRYYVAIFGVFSIIAGVLLSTSPVISKNGRIALLAAVFAIISIIPPTDAFTVSRVSQIRRVESILENEGMLVGGELVKKENPSERTRLEVTNILSYLSRSSSLDYIAWLPDDFELYRDMKGTFGFESMYAPIIGKHFYASLDARKPLPVSNYDVLLNAFVGRYMQETIESQFELNGSTYRLKVNRLSNFEVIVSILNSAGSELVGTGLYEFAQGLVNDTTMTREALHPDLMGFEVITNGYKLKVIFQNISYTSGSDSDSGIDYAMYILFATPNP